jgi:hypothetical protein
MRRRGHQCKPQKHKYWRTITNKQNGEEVPRANHVLPKKKPKLKTISNHETCPFHILKASQG